VPLDSRRDTRRAGPAPLLRADAEHDDLVEEHLAHAIRRERERLDDGREQARVAVVVEPLGERAACLAAEWAWWRRHVALDGTPGRKALAAALGRAEQLRLERVECLQSLGPAEPGRAERDGAPLQLRAGDESPDLEVGIAQRLTETQERVAVEDVDHWP
jgi:hypothetical protein